MTPSAPPGAGHPAGGPPTGRASTRGARTRARILDAAERLWGERGVDGVSQREVRLAAGQRNSSALQFHFGGRDGLLAALAERHLPRVAALQARLHAEAVAAGRTDDLATLVEVLVRPNADYLREGPSARAWVRIVADRAGRSDAAVDDVLTHLPAITLHVGAAVHERLAADLGTTLATERMMAVGTATLHLCADRARAEDTAAASRAAGPASGLGRGPDARVPVRPLLPFATWRTNVLDMAIAAMTAPTRVTDG